MPSVIDQTFLISGHAYFPNDSDFASVESEVKTRPIYVAEDWFIVTCRRQKKFIIFRMNREHFVSTKKLEETVIRRKVNANREPVK